MVVPFHKFLSDAPLNAIWSDLALLKLSRLGQAAWLEILHQNPRKGHVLHPKTRSIAFCLKNVLARPTRHSAVYQQRYPVASAVDLPISSANNALKVLD